MGVTMRREDCHQYCEPRVVRRKWLGQEESAKGEHGSAEPELVRCLQAESEASASSEWLSAEEAAKDDVRRSAVIFDGGW